MENTEIKSLVVLKKPKGKRSLKKSDSVLVPNKVNNTKILGRPTTYSQDIAVKICRLLAEGNSLRSICEENDDLPEARTVHYWLVDPSKETFFQQYKRAREIQAEMMYDALIEESEEDVIVGDDKSDGARVQAQKLKVTTKMWVLSKMLPKKFGDKLDVTSGGDKIQGNTITFMDFRNSAREVDSEIIEEENAG